MGFSHLQRALLITIFTLIKQMAMKTFYQIESKETGIVLLRRRKIAKALRRWLRENNIPFEYTFCLL
jgi:hypothetical protein